MVDARLDNRPRKALPSVDDVDQNVIGSPILQLVHLRS
jgi:hypothetical protein